MDLRLFEKDAVQQMRWTLSDVDNEDYEELMAVLSADENNKMINPEELARQYMA